MVQEVGIVITKGYFCGNVAVTPSSTVTHLLLVAIVKSLYNTRILSQALYDLLTLTVTRRRKAAVNLSLSLGSTVCTCGEMNIGP